MPSIRCWIETLRAWLIPAERPEGACEVCGSIDLP
jgi:hypothetical protein